VSTTYAPAPAPAHDPVTWVSPAPAWSLDPGETPTAEFERPQLVELTGDDFMAAMLQGLGDDPAAAVDRPPADGSGTVGDPAVLYRPIHGRYYLVVGSLVCRRLGLPDRHVDPDSDTTTFVVRRLRPTGTGDATVEQCWVAATGQWVDAVGDDVADGEEQHPMWGAAVGTVASGPVADLLGLAEPGGRQVHLGYVTVGGASSQPRPSADPVGDLAADPARATADDHRLLEFRVRVAGPWSDVVDKVARLGDGVSEPSLFVLLDLRDYLATYLPDVLAALTGGAAVGGAPGDLVTLLASVDVTIVGGGTRPLGTVLGELAESMGLLRGVGTAPSTRYRVDTLPSAGFIDSLGGSGAADGGAVLDALLATDTSTGRDIVPPAELAGAVVPRAAAVADADRFVIRLVYRHRECEPVLSRPSQVVRFAGNYDPDAPARAIRIELPDPAHLRRFSRGVAIDMPPRLRQMLDMVTPKMLKEEGPNAAGTWGLGMICSFSLQIIMLVAFIVMFIFLLLLNIIFWWMPFLKICFPVPTKKSSP
jgi:hypothetical protein